MRDFARRKSGNRNETKFLGCGKHERDTVGNKFQLFQRKRKLGFLFRFLFSGDLFALVARVFAIECFLHGFGERVNA